MTNLLAHILWLGGSACSGKSTIADKLHDQHGIAVFHADEALNSYSGRYDPQKQPCLYRWSNSNNSPTFWDETWMRSGDVLLREVFECYQETFDFIQDDLLNLSAHGPLLAEGNCLMPSTLSPLLTDQRHALWMVPSEAFQRRIYPQRGEWVTWILDQCSQPDAALQNWMDRDVAFAAEIERDALAHGYRVMTVTGERSIDENAALVAEYFELS